jgi:enoyl-CoA hydratase/carnithine racemase
MNVRDQRPKVRVGGGSAHLRLNRHDPRGAIHDSLVRERQTAFFDLPADARMAGVSGEGAHVCGGLALAATAPLRVAESGSLAPAEGRFGESPMPAIAQGEDAATQRVRHVLANRAVKRGKAS